MSVVSPPLQAALDLAVQVRNVSRVAVGSQDDRPAPVRQQGECMEELLRHPAEAIETGDELDVVHQQHVKLGALVAKTVEVVRSDGADHVAAEGVSPGQEDLAPRVLFQKPPGDCLEEVGLAEPRLGVDQERAVRGVPDARIAQVQGCRVGEPIARADNEGIEREGRGKGVAPQRRPRRLGVPGAMRVG